MSNPLVRRARARRVAAIVVAAIVGAGVIQIEPASASHAELSLPGSNFEIDVNANLKVDDSAPSTDWAGVTESRTNDLTTGRDDDSYSGGSKEDDPCPATTTGSIPNNKSDLLTFGAYVEPEANGPGYLNLFWTRVQEPSGTTLMDFELNQSSTDCGNGVNPVRTPGDLLIEYRIEQGGAVATILVREWTGSAWGPAEDLTGTQAAGTINITPIPVAESDGLTTTNPLSARTFGEAQLDLDFVFDSGECESFGSAFLKSRSSDAFTSQLKDLIKPIPVNITNCGTVIIRKQTDPEQDPNVTSFNFSKAFTTDPATGNTFSLQDDGVETFNNVLFGTGLTATESAPPTGWDLASIDCSASTGVTPATSVATRTATFTIDNSADVVDCTFTNRARGTIIVEKQTNPDGAIGDFTFTGTAAGVISDGEQILVADLAPGQYTSTETNPAPAFDLTNITCDDANSSGSVATRTATFNLEAGEIVKCTFTNRQRGTIIVEKQTDPDGAAGNFTFTGTAAGTISDNGQIVVADLTPGQYTSTETNPAPAFDLTNIACNDANSSGSVATRTATFNLEAGETVKCTFTNRQRATINVHKVDDLDNALQGAVFTLFVDNAPLDGAAPHGAEDTSTGLTCTTNASGNCSFVNVIPGQYWVVETTGVPGHGLAADQNVVVAAAATASLTFVDPRLHKVIVVVCHEGTNTLAASDVSDGSTALTTLASSALEAELCALDGFTGKPHGNLAVSVDVGSDAH